MPFSHVQNHGRFTALIKARAVILLSLPTILGTGFFLVGAVVAKLHDFDEADFDDVREPSGLERLKSAVAFALFLTCYCRAAFGPLLLPLAVRQAFELTRAGGARSRDAIWAWTFVGLGLAATALFWGWLIDLDLFV
jgi:hypothetical protein